MIAWYIFKEMGSASGSIEYIVRRRCRGCMNLRVVGHMDRNRNNGRNCVGSIRGMW